ncbi:MAG: hypothetical protein HRU15_07615 [Planctomycetes bacterium]|nr:hypothetical protein [Planctomycetota bacterium]
MLKNESLPAFSWASCNTPLEEEPVSSFDPLLMAGVAEIIDAQTLKIVSFKKLHKKTEYTTFPDDVVGTWILLDHYGYNPGGPNFQITATTGDTLTVKADPSFGDLLTAPRGKPSKDQTVKFHIGSVRLMGMINSHLEWSCSGHDFDKKSTADDIVDSEKRYEISVRLSSYNKRKQNKFMEYKPNDPAATCTTDITPRRLQAFKVKAGDSVHWVNMDYSIADSPQEIASGDIIVDKWGLVTVKKFHIGKQGLGNRLILTIP